MGIFYLYIYIYIYILITYLILAHLSDYFSAWYTYIPTNLFELLKTSLNTFKRILILCFIDIFLHWYLFTLVEINFL